MQGYIKQLIRQDIARNGSAPVPVPDIGSAPENENEMEEGNMITRTYGNASTHLVLTGKALEFYNMTDPITIQETENNGTFSYQVFSGKDPMHDGEMTEAKLIRWLEDGYDEYITST